EKLKKEVLAVMGHQILEGFDFSIQNPLYPLASKSGKYQAYEGKDYHIIKNSCMFGTYPLEIFNTPQVKNGSDTGQLLTVKITQNIQLMLSVITLHVVKSPHCCLFMTLKFKKVIDEDEKLVLYG
ncbi:3030_t:CDS:2, partial [Gigaspora margarita]